MDLTTWSWIGANVLGPLGGAASLVLGLIGFFAKTRVDRDLVDLRASHEKEINNMRMFHDKELQILKLQHDHSIEIIKADHQKLLRIHTVQFDEEFKIYHGLVQSLNEVKRYTLVFKDKINPETRNDLFTRSRDLSGILLRSEPFIPVQIYNHARTVFLAASALVIKYDKARETQQFAGIKEEAELTLAQVEKESLELTIKIRQRIGTTDKTDVVPLFEQFLSTRSPSELMGFPMTTKTP